MPGIDSISISKPVLQPIQHPVLQARDLSLSVLRLDTIHPSLGGNKWYKLKRNLDYIGQQRIDCVLSFGGAWSNHLLALAAAGQHCGFRTVGVIRGEQIDPPTPVLARVKQLGMTLIPVSRQQFRDKMSPQFLSSLRQRVGEFHCLPEGGTNGLAVQGCQEIAEFLRWQSSGRPRVVAAACGTGGMLAGIILGLAAMADRWALPSVLGVAVLKAQGYIAREVSNWLNCFDYRGSIPWRIAESWHCGGYAKTNAELFAFLECLHDACPIPVEPVYSGKLAYGLWKELLAGNIPPGSEVIAIHSGGVHDWNL